MSTKNWGISLRSNVRTTWDADTKNSTYPAVAYKIFRKFATREQARLFKSVYDKKVSIINLASSTVVR